MANEITLNVRLQLSNGALLDDNNPGRIQVNQTTQRKYSVVVSVGTTEESVTFTDISTPGVCYLRNLDATNYVQWGPATTVYQGRLKASDIPACFRLDPGATTLYLKANTAACNVLVTVYAD
jgi:hypothetical protein